MRLSQDDQVNLTTEEKRTKFFFFTFFIFDFFNLIPLINSIFIFFSSFSLPVSCQLFLFGNYFLLLSSHPSIFVDIAAENWFIRIGHCSNVSTDGSGAERCPVWRCIAPTRSLLHVRLFRNEIGCVHIWDCKKYCRTEANWNRVGIVSELSATLARWLDLLFVLWTFLFKRSFFFPCCVVPNRAQRCSWKYRNSKTFQYEHVSNTTRNRSKSCAAKGWCNCVRYFAE